MKPKISTLKKKVWSLYSKVYRIKHSDKFGRLTCYTCGITKPWKEMQCGHGFGGRGNSILFLEAIIKPQCYGCNCCNSGKLDVFTNKLRKELGDEQYEILWRLRSTTRKFTIEELQDMEKALKLWLKERGE